MRSTCKIGKIYQPVCAHTMIHIHRRIPAPSGFAHQTVPDGSDSFRELSYRDIPIAVLADHWQDLMDEMRVERSDTTR